MGHGRASADVASSNGVQPDIGLPHHLFGPGTGSAKLALVGGALREDLNAVSVLSRLASYLRRLAGEAAGRGAPRLTARVMVMPVAPEGADLLTRSAYRLIAVRSPDPELEHYPHVRLTAPDEDEREAACLFGLPVVEQPACQAPADSEVATQSRHGGESFDIVVGRSGLLEAGHCEAVFRALLGFMVRVGLLEGANVGQDEADLHYFDSTRPFDLRCGARGLFVSRRTTGAWLQAGDSIGWIYGAFDGDPRHEIRTPVAGLLSAIRRQPLVVEGDVAARVLST